MPFFQIDVKKIIPEQNATQISIYMPDGYVLNAFISHSDYEYLKKKGVFIRRDETPDSAGVINTTIAYDIKTEK